MDISCCNAGSKFMSGDTTLCSTKQTLQVENWYSGTVNLAKDSSEILYCIDTTILSVAATVNAWGFISFRTGWNAYGLRALQIWGANGFKTSYEGPMAFSDTTWQTYECPHGTSINGVYYSGGARTITASNGQTATYNLITDFGFQCMPLFCTTGKYSAPSAMACLDCPVGTYNSNSYTTACARCTTGTALINGAPDYSGLTYTSSGGGYDSCQFTCNAGYGGGGTTVSQCLSGCCKCLPGYYSAPGGTCTPCPAGSISGTAGATACTPCQAGSTYMSTTGGSACIQCTTVSPGSGYYVIKCTATSNAQTLMCTSCNAGYYLSPSCVPGLNTGQVPACVQCPAGKVQPVAITTGMSVSPTCDFCSAGQFQSMAGMPACENCKNPAPANGAYASWTVASTDGNSCPTLCYPTFGWNGTRCVSCALGKYGTGGLIPASICQECQTLTQNAYWLAPVIFNRSWSGCPWDCKAGYYKTALANCAPCQTGKYSSLIRASDSEPVNQCLQCTVCPTSSFASVPCNASQDSICSPCVTSCSPGAYLNVQCNATTNNVCVACRTTCAEGQYMTRLCTGLVSLFLPVDIMLSDWFSRRRPTTPLCASRACHPPHVCRGCTCLRCSALAIHSETRRAWFARAWLARLARTNARAT